MLLTSASLGYHRQLHDLSLIFRIFCNDELLPIHRFFEPIRLLHPLYSAAVRLSVTRLIVEMKAGKAVRTMVAVSTSGTFRRYKPCAYLTGKAVIARIRFIISLFKFSSFIFSVQVISSCNSDISEFTGGLPYCFANLPFTERSPSY